MKTKNLYVELKSQFHKDNYTFFILAVAGSLLSAFLGLGISWLTKELIDTAAGTGRWTISQLAVITAGVALFFLFTTFLTYISQPRYIRKAMQNYKETLFSKLTEKNITSFRSESTSTYLSALTNDSISVETNYLEKEFSFINRMTSFVASLAMMILYSPLLTLIAVVVTILPLVVSLLTGKKLASEEVVVSDKNKNFTAMIGDCLNGFSVVKSFRAEKEIFKLFSSENTKLENSKFIRRKLQILISSLGLLSGFLAQIGVFFAGTYLAVSGKGMTAGTVIMFVNLMNFVIQPVAELPGLLAARRASKALIQKISDSLMKSSFCGGNEKLSKLDSGIRVKNVSFSYEEGKEVLHDVSVNFEAGKSYAIVGGSGSGKSTLLNLLVSSTCGAEYDGSIMWDNMDLKSASSDSLFEQVSSIEQNVFVFNSSISDNITMFRDFPKAEVDEAIARANLRKLIDERGQNYLCGENGSGLSGGEKQRISIARSLLKKSSVLLADEITAALDAQTAYRVSSDILDLSGITRIVVTHALDENLLRRYDKILVMKDGRLQEEGTFDELMAKKQYFHALYTVAE
ncbi:MAG: ABC transporter ATP-binding protein [Clostridiales bacterium]|nr:ABC transporter ATP-binding protein [Clostridiales bacterium]